MRQSELFTRTRREAPADEVSKNAQLLIRAGFVHKEMAGVYSLLPLGLRVLNKINTIIREEMDAIGGQEVFLSALQERSVWESTKRWETFGNWFKTKLADGSDLGLGFTHEEPLTAIMTNHVSSYRDLPKYAYQIQTKFRNEERAKSGILRGREFLMKDLYSFSRTPEEHEVFYEKAKQAYRAVFSRVGLGDRTYVTFASGGSFSKYSHEFQTVADVGEDTIYIDEKKGIAVNKEVYTDEVLADLGLSKETLVERKAIEVGNIFSLGTRFSDALKLQYRDEGGVLHPVIMGSYGIGPTRLMGTIVEIFSDEKGIVWPKTVAPFDAHVIVLTPKQGEGGTRTFAEDVVTSLEKAGIAVLYDDRDTTPGDKFADADLIGIPYRIIVSEKTVSAHSVELKGRTESESKVISVDELLAVLRG